MSLHNEHWTCRCKSQVFICLKSKSKSLNQNIPNYCSPCNHIMNKTYNFEKSWRGKLTLLIAEAPVSYGPATATWSWSAYWRNSGFRRSPAFSLRRHYWAEVSAVKCRFLSVYAATNGRVSNWTAGFSSTPALSCCP